MQSKLVTSHEALIQTPDWNRLEAAEIQDITPSEHNTFLISTNQGDLFLSFNKFGLRLHTDAVPHNRYGLIVNPVTNDKATLACSEGEATLISGTLTLAIQYAPLKFKLERQANNGYRQTSVATSSDGHFEREHRVPTLCRFDDNWLFSIGLKSGESVYGLGEKWGKLNKRGQLIRSYNHDALGVNAEISYKNTPFAWSPEGWGIFLHTSAPVTHAVGYPAWSQRSYCSVLEHAELDLFLLLPEIADSNCGASLIGAYTELTGRAPVPPDWTAGIILSKAYYADANEILSVAKEVREKSIPCEVISFDGRAWQDTDTRFSFEWCKKRYPEPEKVLAELRAMDFKICIWEYPLVSRQHGLFKQLADKGWLIKDKRTGEAFEYHWDDQAFGNVLTPLPVSGLIDFTHPEAYAFWLESHQPLFEMGVDMIKADFGEQLEDPNMLAYDGSHGIELHNVYAHLYNRCVYEAAERYAPNGPFLFSRSSWTGCQRFNSQWGGDPQADWEGMMGNIRGGLSWGMSGAPFYATDIGGFYRDKRDADLYVRWTQNAIFSAHYRLHGIGSREPWSYGEPAATYATTALQIREALRPYILEGYAQSSATGIPLQRPMVIAFPDQPQCWDFENQFMFGDDLLVVLCGDPDGWVEYYLPDVPEKKWQQWDPNGKYQAELEPGQFYRHQLQADEIAVFIPWGREIKTQ